MYKARYDESTKDATKRERNDRLTTSKARYDKATENDIQKMID